MNLYNLEFVKLETFDNLRYGKYHYNYKTIDFMLSYQLNVNKTVIVFHARVNGPEKIPVFYKHNCKSDKFNVLSISDKLLEYAKNCHNMIYTGTTEIEYNKIYEEIIQNVLKIVGTQTNIFFGSCSGAHPALRYGLLFNGVVVVTNGYVFIDKTTYDTYGLKLKKQTGLLFINFDKINTEELIKIHAPQHLYLYINKNDTFVFNLNKNFYLKCKKYFPDKVSLIVHDTQIEGYDSHAVFYPENQTFETIIENI